MYIVNELLKSVYESGFVSDFLLLFGSEPTTKSGHGVVVDLNA